MNLNKFNYYKVQFDKYYVLVKISGKYTGKLRF